MNIRLNLATKPLVSERKFLAGSAVLAGIAFLVLLFLGARFYSLRKAEESLREKSGKIQKELAAAEGQKKELDRYFEQQESAGFREQAKFVVGVLQERGINWTQMFMDLEKTLPPGTHVLKIEPKLEKGVVSVHFVVGAQSQDAELKLLKAFEGSSSFSRVELTTEKAATQPGNDPLTVEFDAVYSHT